MTLVEQIEYINKIKDKVTESGKYRFETHGILNGYLVIKILTNSCVMRIERLNLNETFNIICFNPDNKTDIKDYINCSLEDFLSTYFCDMVNPSPEEKVMWMLQFGFDWFF